MSRQQQQQRHRAPRSAARMSRQHQAYRSIQFSQAELQQMFSIKRHHVLQTKDATTSMNVSVITDTGVSQVPNTEYRRANMHYRKRKSSHTRIGNPLLVSSLHPSRRGLDQEGITGSGSSARMKQNIQAICGWRSDHCCGESHSGHTRNCPTSKDQ